MKAEERRFCPDSLTERVIGAILEVSNTLGAGFLEKVYERALLREFELRNIRATAQASFAVSYKDRCVGDYYADLQVEDVLLVELKCVDRLTNEHMSVRLRTKCLFAREFQKSKVEWRRIVLEYESPGAAQGAAKRPAKRPALSC